MHTPVLLLVGQKDTIIPLESQKQMRELLGTPEGDKKLVSYNVPGHGVRRDKAEEETLSWSDKYLGKVQLKD